MRGRNTMASRTMKTTPERNEYRRSFVACGGGLRFRLKGTSGLEGRRIFMGSLHVDRRPSGDGVVRLLRDRPLLREVASDPMDADLPRGRRVERESLRRDPRDLQDLADVGQRGLKEGLRGLRSRIDLGGDRLRIPRVHHEPIAPETMPNLLADVRHERSEQL